MSLTRVQRRFTTWLAMLALVLTTLAPTLAQAVVKASDRSDWVQICSTTGMVWVKADAKADPASPDSGSAPMVDMGMQCPWCSLHSPATGLPPSAPLGSACAEPASPVDGFTTALPPAGLWIAAPARAPPTIS